MKHNKGTISFIVPITLLVFSAFVFPSYAHAQMFSDSTTLSSATNMLTQAQSNYQTLSTLKPLAGQATQISQTAGQLNNMAQGFQALQTLSSLPAFQNIPGAGTIGGITSLLSSAQTITSLPIMQNVPGMQALTQNLGSLSALPNFVSQATDVMNNPSIYNVGALVQQLSNPAGPLQSISSSVSNMFGLGGGTNQNQLLSAVQNKLPEVSKAVTSVMGGAGGQALTNLATGQTKATIGVVGQIANPQALGAGMVVDCGVVGANAVGALGTNATSKLTQAASSKLPIGIGQGVPVIEQSGSLLTTTIENKSLSAEMCKQLTAFMTKLTKDDPTATEAAAQKMKEAQTKWKTYLSGQGTGGTVAPSGSGVTSSGTQTSPEDIVGFVDQAGDDGYMSAAEQVIKARPELKGQIEAEIAMRNDPAKAIQMQLTKTPVSDKKGLDYGLIKSDPTNDPLATIIRGKGIIQQAEVKGRTDAQLKTASGIAPKTECKQNEQSTVKGGKQYCLPQNRVVTRTAASIVAVSSAYDQAPITRLANVDQKGEDTPAIKYEDENRNTIVNPPAAGTTGAGGTTGTSGWNLNDIFGAAQMVCQMQPQLAMCTGQWGSQNQGSTAGGDTTATQYTPAAPLPPNITTQSYTQKNATYSDLTTISWAGNNADTCVATNDWFTWGTGSAMTASSTVLFASGSNIGVSGSQTIYHPALFKGSVEVNRSWADKDYSTQPAAQPQLVYSIKNNAEEALFTPALGNIHPTDIFTLTLNQKRLSTNDVLTDATAQSIVMALKNAKVNINNSDPIKEEFSHYEFDSASSTTLLIRRTSETGGPMASSSVYKIQCTGPAGVDNKEITVQF